MGIYVLFTLRLWLKKKQLATNRLLFWDCFCRNLTLERLDTKKIYSLRRKCSVKRRMHSSGMRTAHLLTVSQHALGRGVYPSLQWEWGVCPRGYLPGGVWPGGVWPGGVWQGDVWWGGVCPEWGVSVQGCGGVTDTSPEPEANTSPVNRMTDRQV